MPDFGRLCQPVKFLVAFMVNIVGSWIFALAAIKKWKILDDEIRHSSFFCDVCIVFCVDAFWMPTRYKHGFKKQLKD